MGGFFGAASQTDCVFDLFFGIDYHSHLGTRRAGMAVYSPETGFDKAIHNIEVYNGIAIYARHARHRLHLRL